MRHYPPRKPQIVFSTKRGLVYVHCSNCGQEIARVERQSWAGSSVEAKAGRALSCPEHQEVH